LKRKVYSKNKLSYPFSKSVGIYLKSIVLLITLVTQVVSSANASSGTGSVIQASESDKYAESISNSKQNKINPEDIIILEPITVFATPESLSLTVPDIKDIQA
jgi:hypothetical protein